MSKFRPHFGSYEEPVKPTPPRVYHNAILNLPEPGTKVRVELQGWVAEGVVRYTNAAYGTITIEKDIWINHHFKGKIELRIEVEHGWDIEILEEPESAG